MKIKIILNTCDIIIPEEIIRQENVRALTDKAQFNIDEQKLLREFARQYLDNPDYFEPGCPLCGDIR